MNRYLLLVLAALGTIGLATVYGVDLSRDALQQSPDDTGEVVRSVQDTATNELTGIEAAGQNVIPQTSEEGLARSRDLPGTQVQNVQAETTPPATTVSPDPAVFPEQNLEAVQPVAPATPPATDQDPIPALW
jgi:hypothetical protein